jgi:hypothetical protein
MSYPNGEKYSTVEKSLAVTASVSTTLREDGHFVLFYLTTQRGNSEIVISVCYFDLCAVHLVQFTIQMNKCILVGFETCRIIYVI